MSTQTQATSLYDFLADNNLLIKLSTRTYSDRDTEYACALIYDGEVCTIDIDPSHHTELYCVGASAEDSLRSLLSTLEYYQSNSLAQGSPYYLYYLGVRILKLSSVVAYHASLLGLVEHKKLY